MTLHGLPYLSLNIFAAAGSFLMKDLSGSALLSGATATTFVGRFLGYCHGLLNASCLRLLSCPLDDK